MANYSNLKAAIAAAIKQNGNQEITGQVLQDVLTSMVSVIGANYTFAGVATPSTNPGTPDQNVVYMASQAGTYINFGGAVLPAGIHLLMWNGTWSTQTFFTVDDEPTAGSGNLVKSGGVYHTIYEEIFNSLYNNFINVDISEKNTDYYILSSNNWSHNTNAGGIFIPVIQGEKYLLRKNLSITKAIRYAFLTSNSTSGTYPSYVSGYEERLISVDDVLLSIPATCNYLYIQLYEADGNSVSPLSVLKCQEIYVPISEMAKTIKPKLVFDYTRGLNGEFSNHYENFANGLFMTTPRFIKTNKDFHIRCSRNCLYVMVIYFDKNYNYISYKSVEGIIANTDYSVPTPVNCSYVKITVEQDANGANKEVQVELDGIFPDNWDVFNIRPSDNGYHHIYSKVELTQPDSCNAETQTVQDVRTIGNDFGVICLPPTYDNTGEPTRLIIYMHGAGTHYTKDSIRFSNRHVEPDYWLAEGYAVMDVDGNPFYNPTTANYAHAFIPQAMDCYAAAYQWAIEHYNIRRDGVLLGGRSMGAGNTMNLIRQSCPIPIIAGCANLPTSFAAGSSTKESKEFYAEHKGYIIPEGFEYQDGMPTAAEKQVLYDNWDKAVTIIPALHLVADIPVEEQWKKDFIDSCTTNRQDELVRIELCKDLHMIIHRPLKMFACNQDPNNSIDAASGLYYRMLKNAAQMTELRIFNSYMDYSGTGWTAHYYELADPALRTDVVTKFGETISNVPMVYIEMLQYWRRYEQMIK